MEVGIDAERVGNLFLCAVARSFIPNLGRVKTQHSQCEVKKR